MNTSTMTHPVSSAEMYGYEDDGPPPKPKPKAEPMKGVVSYV